MLRMVFCLIRARWWKTNVESGGFVGWLIQAMDSLRRERELRTFMCWQNDQMSRGKSEREP